MPLINHVFANNVRYYSVFKGRHGEQSISEIFDIISKYSSNVVGENIILSGIDVNFNIDENKVLFDVSPGWLIQDNMLLNQQSLTELTIDNLTHFNTVGIIVLNLRFKTYVTRHQYSYDELQLRYNHIMPNGTAYFGWDHQKDSIILGLYNFDVDNDGKVTLFKPITNKQLLIEDKIYTIGGWELKNYHLSKYLDEYFKLKGIIPGGSSGGGTAVEGTLNRYIHAQSTLESTWNIQHNLNLKPFLVQTYNNSGERIEGFVDWKFANENNIKVSFSEPLSGYAEVLA